MNRTREIKNLKIYDCSKTNETRMIELSLDLCILIEINIHENNFTII